MWVNCGSDPAGSQAAINCRIWIETLKKILLISNIFPPAIGGPATYGVRLGEGLSKEGYEVRYLCATAAPAYTDQQYPFKVIRAGTRGNRLRREVAIRLRLLLAMRGVDMIYCMGLEHQSHWAARLARKRYALRIGGDKVWEQARNSGITRSEPGSFYKEAERRERLSVEVEEKRRQAQLRDAAAVVYVSNYLKNLAVHWCGRQGRVEFVVPNGVEVGTDADASLTRRREDEPLRVLFVGRQTNWKGVDAALLAVARVSGTMLTVAGSGPVWPGNVDLSTRLGVSERTAFVGRVDNPDIAEMMARHHVLVLPSLYEGMSNTLLEAGAAGLACIASDRGGNPEVIEQGVTGLLVDPFDVTALCSAITLLRDDDSVRMRLANQLRERVRREFQLSRSVTQTIEVLRDVGADNANNDIHFLAGSRRR